MLHHKVENKKKEICLVDCQQLMEVKPRISRYVCRYVLYHYVTWKYNTYPIVTKVHAQTQKCPYNHQVFCLKPYTHIL